MANPTCPRCFHVGTYSEGAKRMMCPNEGCEVMYFGQAHEPPASVRSTGKTFEARYPGYCHGCGGRFIEGDVVGFLDDELHCEPCIEVLSKAGARAEKPLDVCQTCFTAKAANGTCGCD